MPDRRSFASLFLLAALTACQGSFGSGGTAAPGGIAPPVNPQQQVNPGGMTPTPIPSAHPNPTPPTGAATYAFASASTEGLQCPQDQGFSCVLRFNVKATPEPSPSASANAKANVARGKATQSPSPTPSPTPTPSPEPSSSASPGASPNAKASGSPKPSAATITLTSKALPKDAPKMENPDPKAVATVALMTVALHAGGDIILQGKAIADFTLPKEQIGGRGFALQLFRQSVKHRKTIDTFAGSYNKSDYHGKDTLRFQIDMPKFQVKKDETWLLVLYGDEMPNASASPKPGSSASPGASPSASASPQASPSAAPSASASP